MQCYLSQALGEIVQVHVRNHIPLAKTPFLYVLYHTSITIVKDPYYIATPLPTYLLTLFEQQH